MLKIKYEEVKKKDKEEEDKEEEDERMTMCFVNNKNKQK